MRDLSAASASVADVKPRLRSSIATIACSSSAVVEVSTRIGSNYGHTDVLDPMNHEDITIFWAAEFVGEHAAIRVNAVPVPLPDARYQVMATLIDARLGSASGRIDLADALDISRNLAAQTIRRTRIDIAAVCGHGVGDLLIASCRGAAYRLTISEQQITIHPNLIELAPSYLATELVRRMLENATIHDSCAENREITTMLASR